MLRITVLPSSSRIACKKTTLPKASVKEIMAFLTAMPRMLNCPGETNRALKLPGEKGLSTPVDDQEVCR